MAIPCPPLHFHALPRTLPSHAGWRQDGRRHSAHRLCARGDRRVMSRLRSLCARGDRKEMLRLCWLCESGGGRRHSAHQLRARSQGRVMSQLRWLCARGDDRVLLWAHQFCATGRGRSMSGAEEWGEEKSGERRRGRHPHGRYLFTSLSQGRRKHQGSPVLTKASNMHAPWQLGTVQSDAL